jgi:uncharacterized protein (DUF2141 family)
MNRVNLRQLLLCSIAFLSSAQAFAQATKGVCQFKLTVDGLEKKVGFVRVSIELGQNGYDKKITFKSASVEVEGKSATILTELPYGEYAIKTFHDLNSDSELNLNLLGIPSEPYGISNDARAAFGLPSYSDAKITVNKPEQEHKITVKTHI